MEQRRETALLNLNTDYNIKAVRESQRLHLILKDVLELSDSQGVCPCVPADMQAGTWSIPEMGEKTDIFCTPHQGYSLSKGTEMAVHALLLPAKVWDDEWAAGFTAGQSQPKSLKAPSQESSSDFTVWCSTTCVSRFSRRSMIRPLVLIWKNAFLQ